LNRATGVILAILFGAAILVTVAGGFNGVMIEPKDGFILLVCLLIIIECFR